MSGSMTATTEATQRPSADDVLLTRVEDVSDALRTELLDCWFEASLADGAIGFVAASVDREAVAASLDARLAEVRRGDTWLGVLWAAGQVAGYGFLSMPEHPLRGHWTTVYALQVHPRYQRRGFGRILLEELHDLARSAGREFCHLSYRDGHGLGEFYGKVGYVEVGRIPGAIRVAPGDDRDEVLMVRRLD